MAAKSGTKATTIDEYLAFLSDDKRAALETLRRTIRAAAPKAEECISYQLPAFRQEGMLVGFGATGNHCALYLMNDTTLAAHRDELKDYDTSKGTIRFQVDNPLPAALVRKLVKARLAENMEKSGAGKPTAPAKKCAGKNAAAGDPPGRSKADPGVDQFMRELDHPLKSELESLRRIIRSAGPDIREGIKWNSPSFRTSDYFATINVHGKGQLRLILHTGAKVKEDATKGLKITDPSGLLKWLAKDRCLVTLGDAKDIKEKRGALEAIIREWIKQL